jgi:hypothetical protein
MDFEINEHSPKKGTILMIPWALKPLKEHPITNYLKEKSFKQYFSKERYNINEIRI